MKVLRITSTAILSLLLGISAPSYGQQVQQQEKQGHPEQQQSKHEQAKPEQQKKAERQQQPNQGKQQQHAQQQEQNKQQQQHVQRQEQNRQQQQHAQQQEQNRQQQQSQARGTYQRGQPVQRGQEREAWQQHRATNWQSEHRDWQQRGGYNGYRIPDNRYRGNFGENHRFRIHRYPMELYGGYPRFQYGGYWFGFMDPWPEYWGDDWYDNDDVYIVFSGGGYYLYNRRHPRDRIAISVYLR
jgi:Tfp pilus assembly protein FimT